MRPRCYQQSGGKLTMSRNISFLPVAVIFSLLVSCSGNGQETNGKGISVHTGTFVAEGFPYPAIPVVLTSLDERKAWLLVHYWDNFDFTDTTLVNKRGITEQGLVNQLALLRAENVTQEEIVESINNLCTGMERQEHARRTFMRLMDDYLYDPNSPYYNEALYAAYLQRMLKSAVLEETGKGSLKFRLELIKRNAVGSKATDFSYLLPGGQQHTLWQTQVHGGKLLLVFYDPECPTCHKVLREMIMDKTLNTTVSKEEITILAIYTEGDENVWRKTLSEMPSGWIVGNDCQMVKDSALYDLKAMPSIYLLNENKQVILKDAAYATIRQVLGL